MHIKIWNGIFEIINIDRSTHADGGERWVSKLVGEQSLLAQIWRVDAGILTSMMRHCALHLSISHFPVKITKLNHVRRLHIWLQRPCVCLLCDKSNLVIWSNPMRCSWLILCNVRHRRCESRALLIRFGLHHSPSQMEQHFSISHLLWPLTMMMIDGINDQTRESKRNIKISPNSIRIIFICSGSIPLATLMLIAHCRCCWLPPPFNRIRSRLRRSDKMASSKMNAIQIYELKVEMIANGLNLRASFRCQIDFHLNASRSKRTRHTAENRNLSQLGVPNRIQCAIIVQFFLFEFR